MPAKVLLHQFGLDVPLVSVTETSGVKPLGTHLYPQNLAEWAAVRALAAIHLTPSRSSTLGDPACSASEKLTAPVFTTRCQSLIVHKYTKNKWTLSRDRTVR